MAGAHYLLTMMHDSTKVGDLKDNFSVLVLDSLPSVEERSTEKEKLSDAFIYP